MFRAAPTSGFTTELIVRSESHGFVAFYKIVRKNFDAEIIDKVWICDMDKIQA